MVSSFSTAEWLSVASMCIDAIGIILGACVAIWVIISIQKKIDDKKVLRDHLCYEVIVIKEKYQNFITSIIQGNIKALEIKREFRRLSIRSNDIMKILHEQYGINQDFLSSYQLDLFDIVEEDNNYIISYKRNMSFHLKDTTQERLVRFEADNNILFTNLLISIYTSQNEN